jgi:hypothetical protein
MSKKRKIVGWMKQSASTEYSSNGGTTTLVPPYNTGFPPQFTLAKAGAGMTEQGLFALAIHKLRV